MLKRRIKIDVRSQGLPEAARIEAREGLIEQYLTYPSTTMLFFLKQVRLTVLAHGNEKYLERAMEDPQSRPEDPEDIIAQGKFYRIPDRLANLGIYLSSPAFQDITSCGNRVARDNISQLWLTQIALHDTTTAEKINLLMYKTVMNDIDREKYPILENELWVTPTRSLEGAFRLRMIGKFVFGLPGRYSHP